MKTESWLALTQSGVTMSAKFQLNICMLNDADDEQIYKLRHQLK